MPYSGAFLPGINAVVMITSTSLHCAANNACSASINAWDISLLYPSAVPPSSCKYAKFHNFYVERAILTKLEYTLMLIVRNSAPRLSICSLTAERVSNARTIAPMLFACAAAAKPATPPPTT